MSATTYIQADTSDGKIDSGLACARAGGAKRIRSQTCRNVIIDGGVGGFNFLRSSCPATAPTLMRRFFLRAETFDFFQKKSSFSNARQQILSTKQGRSVGQPRISSIYFLTGFGRSLSKNCREIPGGRGAMTSKGAE